MASNGRRGGSMDDMPRWWQPVALEIRAFIREGREDRRQAVEDRRQAAEDRRQAHVDRQFMRQALVVIATAFRDFRSEQRRQTGLLERLVDLGEGTSKKLDALIRATNGRRNGPRGNGR